MKNDIDLIKSVLRRERFILVNPTPDSIRRAVMLSTDFSRKERNAIVESSDAVLADVAEYVRVPDPSVRPPPPPAPHVIREGIAVEPKRVYKSDDTELSALHNEIRMMRDELAALRREMVEYENDRIREAEKLARELSNMATILGTVYAMWKG